LGPGWRWGSDAVAVFWVLEDWAATVSVIAVFAAGGEYACFEEPCDILTRQFVPRHDAVRKLLTGRLLNHVNGPAVTVVGRLAADRVKTSSGINHFICKTFRG
jgi:hypothetical protein